MPLASAAPDSAGRGSDVIDSVIALPLVRSVGQTDRAVQAREDIGSSLACGLGRDRWITRHAGQVSEPEETVRRGSGLDEAPPYHLMLGSLRQVIGNRPMCRTPR